VLRLPLLPQPPREFAIFAALALGPMMLGHTGMNWALKYLPAYVVNLTVLGEPVGATILAALIPGIGEVPRAWTVAGGALILIGVVVTSARSR
jgi:drug/metabolite transporter (DMT)-like permease